jgi:hypothetical protein
MCNKLICAAPRRGFELEAYELLLMSLIPRSKRMVECALADQGVSDGIGGWSDD